MGKRRSFLALCILAAVALALAPMATTGAAAAERIFLKVGASSLGGSWFPTMAMTAEVINFTLPNVTATVTTGGAITNIKNIEQRKIDLGFTYSASTGEAWHGRGPFKKPHRNIRAVGVYYLSAFQITVPADSPIKTFYDIKGKRTTAGKMGWGSTLAYARLLEAHGLSFDKIRKAGGKVHHVGWSEAVLLMKDRQVDVIQLAQPIPNPLIYRIETAFPVRVLSVEQSILDGILKKYPGYVKVKIPAGMYKGQKEDAWTMGDLDVLIIRADLPEELAYKITKAIYDNPAPFKKLAWLKNMSYKNATQGVPIPFHPGAARYFREKGIKLP